MSDNTPDFDKMSPEEIMAWMETLAKRQGATEGLTTSADMDIPVIDPSTVVIDEPGYVPYGQERTQPVKAQPPAPKAPEKPARAPEPIAPPARSQAPATPVSQPPRQAPPTPPTPARPTPAQPPTSARPSPTGVPPAAMSQERPPARPQTPPTPTPPTRTATEGRTMPPSQPPRNAPPPTTSQPPRPSTPTPSQPPRPSTPPQQNVTPPPRTPSAPPPPRTSPPPPPTSSQPPAGRTPTSPVQPQRPAPPAPSASQPPRQQAQTPPQPPQATVGRTPAPQSSADDGGALAWLESLAADQGEELFNLDLSDLPTTESATPTSAPEAPTNPMTWLEDLARSQVAEPSLEQLGSIETDEEESEKLDPFAENVNPMEWLETLAKRQGAKDEELTTGASLNIPQAQAAEVEQNDYQPFSFDTPPTRRSPEPAAPENPADFLTSLAGEQGYSESGVLATQPDEDIPDNMSMMAIEDALSSGTVTREQMQKFLDQTTNQMADTPEETDEVDLDLDGPLAPAEIPDWLSDLMPSAPAPAAPTPTKPIDALFEAPASVDMPDWLRQDVLGDASTSDIDSIFDAEESEPLTPINAAPIIQEQTPAYQIEVDSSDPWVEAFDEEYEQGGAADVDTVPEWYEQNLHDPERIAAVEGQTEYQETIELEDAPLPAENGLTAGQSQGIPEWVTGFDQRAEEEETAPTNVFEEMPDWLKEVESSVSPQDVPDWLVETISPQDVIEPQYDEPIEEVYTPPAPPPVVQAPSPRPVTPAPKPVTPPPPPQPRVAAPTGPVAEVIERARDREQSGDLEGALAEYESMIRSNSGLDAVVEELGQLVKSYKTTPAVYRVLGDGLMRQGKLQQALNTYREALNQI